MQLRDKVAVVTGGSSGIGLATARLFQAEGGKVAVLDLQPARPDLRRIACDVSKENEVEQAFDTIVSELGAPDILVNCAGVAARQTVAEQSEQGWNACLDVNLGGVFLTSKHAIRRMPAKGSIIHVSSVTGIVGVRNRSAYSASKGAIVALTRTMALDYASRGIRVNCVCPGFVETPLIGALMRDPERKAKITALHPLGRLGQPEDIAKAMLFLASDQSSWITGQVIAVDGGFSAGHAADV
jgi:NAD(P)-dependent dehydrogenase (short-subunit alcohol dehydrogenase family)